MQEAADILAEHGRAIEEFRLILAVVRNPYDLQVSHFEHKRKAHVLKRHHSDDPVARLARSNDFAAFVKNAPFYRASRIESYYQLKERNLPALRIVRFEQMAKDLRDALSSIGVENGFELPHRNKTVGRRDWRDYLTPETEAAIHGKFGFLFDFYPRHLFGCRTDWLG